MAETEKPAAAKKPPKGGRKGGSIFPKLNLHQALAYSKKVVSKTHTGPQPEKTILPGVFGNAGPLGKVRASALKQYGLLEGAVDAYKATDLAKEIDASPEEDRLPLLQQAFRSSKLFNQVFETFHGDTVSRAKIEQRAKGLNVHPDSASECAQLFIDSAVTANLGTVSGDLISLSTAGPTSSTANPDAAELVHEDAEEQKKENIGDRYAGDNASADKNANVTAPEESNQRRPGVNLTLTVDPSSDPDKLEKQLKLLRQYGII